MEELSLQEWVEKAYSFGLRDIKELKEKIIKDQACNIEKEYIDESDCELAKTIVDNLDVDSMRKLFLYCSALNLLNSYAKDSKKPDYSFKKYIENIVEYCVKVVENDDKIKDQISFCIQDVRFINKAKNNKQLIAGLFIVNLAGIQFSFHHISFSENASRIISEQICPAFDKEKTSLYKKQEWEGIKLQRIAPSLIEFAIKLVKAELQNENEHVKLRINDIDFDKSES